MGRLDDIVRRNEQALGGDGPEDNAITRWVENDGPPVVERPFTLPSQRRERGRWKIVLVSIVFAALLIVYAVTDALLSR